MAFHRSERNSNAIYWTNLNSTFHYGTQAGVAEMDMSKKSEQSRIPEFVDRALDVPPEQREMFIEQLTEGDQVLAEQIKSLIRDSEGDPPPEFLEPPDRTPLQKLFTTIISIFWKNPGES